MNAQQFLTWMRSVRTPSENPGQTDREVGAQLDSLLDSFPYFQSGHLLYIKNLHNQGSFLYNNQLKTAAAYAVNRKVLYNLITLKTTENRRETGSIDYAQDDKQSASFDYAQDDKQPAVVQVDSKQSSDVRSVTEDAQEVVAAPVEEVKEEVSVPPKFPEKRFTKNPDEWEAGMLRQLQLLHHWQQQTTEDRRQTEEQASSFDYVQDDKQTTDDRRQTGADSAQETVHSAQETVRSEQETVRSEQPTAEEITEQKKPDAKEEINTLLYVLVEPGASEDLPEEIEEVAAETVTEEGETQWEISVPVEPKEETTPPVVVPGDAVQQDILVEAIHSTFELEVDDKIPSVDELKPFRLEPIEEAKAPEPVAEGKPQEEVVVTGMEMSFSQWLQEVGKANKGEPGKPEAGKPEAVKSELPKTALSTDALVEQFIKEEPRIQVKKSGFFNPVNMAKKSVQESDEFITETLARIYAKQGNTVKAIRAYQKLSLKFPEKTAYFAALIEELKRTPNK